MIKDIEGKEIEVGDEIVFNDGMGINKARVLAISDKTIKIQEWSPTSLKYPDNDTNYIKFLKLNSWNGKYLYKIIC